MALIDKLFPASFDGIPFLTRSADTTSGRKTVTHEYPNADRRFVEDLGKTQKVFTIEGIITGTNDDYFQKRDALIQALESPGIKILVHHFFGTQQVVAKPYRLNEKTDSLNEASFSMTFEKADLNIFPAEGASNNSKISSIASSALGSFGNDVASLFGVTSTFVNNFSDSQNQLTDIANIFSDTIATVTNDVNEISTFRSTVDKFVDNINSNIKNPAQLSTDMINLFDIANQTADSATDRFNLFRRFFNFGDGDVEIIPSTVEKIERKRNRDLLRNFMQGGSLAKSYDNASQVEYKNSQILLDVREVLETQFQKVANG
jgi:prophage DNA circulation protein